MATTKKTPAKKSATSTGAGKATTAAVPQPGTTPGKSTKETTTTKTKGTEPASPTQTASPQEVGNGGELHQLAGGDSPPMTTAHGTPVQDDQNSLRAGDRGPTLMSDFAFREKIFHFDHERIPERVVHARGYGAHGVFENYESLSDITRASIFAEAGKQTETFVRFSTVAGNLGSFDLARDVRGFATKFYTDEGNWDLVGNNIPVFFIQDAVKFPDLVHSVKEEPDRGFPQAQSAHDTFWDFASLMPESTHMTLWQMSDRAIPRSFRMMQGFGVHTFRFVNEAGESTFVKFHWRPLLGMQSVVWNEAVKINGADPDFHRRDLFDAITAGDFPEWELGVQVFDDAFADSFDFDVLDATKIIPEEVLPVRPIGKMTLNRVVDNVFAEIEQVAFMTQNVPPGIDFSNDPLLQGRNFSYLDTQLKRLGSTNFSQIPVNAPRCPVAHFQRDGHMQMAPQSGRTAYEPNSFSGDDRGPREAGPAGHVPFPGEVTGETRRIRAESFADHYSQARQFWLSQTPVEQDHIVAAYVFELGKCEVPAIRERMVANLRNVDESLATQVADGLGMPLPAASETTVPARDDLEPSPALSILANALETFEGRKLGLLVGDGADASAVKRLQQGVAKAGGMVEVIAVAVGGATLSDGTLLEADQAIAGAPSVLYDAVAIVAGSDGTPLANEPAARDFVADAFTHYKVIGLAGSTDALVAAAGLDGKLEGDSAVLPVGSAKDATAFVSRLAGPRQWERDLRA
ncbi:catalase [Knoellia remsis]|uniref:Catalase n=1 Tax=Knoellia remsis TaxID=407159 RepID=A0A2T0UGM4_9MICO|nr:catalase [Knoellia remsis]PRY57062.1 catalase [Knoellia remsis]